MIYTAIAIFLLASIVLLLALCRMAKQFGDLDAELLSPSIEAEDGSSETSTQKHDKAA